MDDPASPGIPDCQLGPGGNTQHGRIRILIRKICIVNRMPGQIQDNLFGNSQHCVRLQLQIGQQCHGIACRRAAKRFTQTDIFRHIALAVCDRGNHGVAFFHGIGTVLVLHGEIAVGTKRLFNRVFEAAAGDITGGVGPIVGVNTVVCLDLAAGDGKPDWAGGSGLYPFELKCALCSLDGSAGHIYRGIAVQLDGRTRNRPADLLQCTALEMQCTHDLQHIARPVFQSACVSPAAVLNGDFRAAIRHHLTKGERISTIAGLHIPGVPVEVNRHILV